METDIEAVASEEVVITPIETECESVVVETMEPTTLETMTPVNLPPQPDEQNVVHAELIGTAMEVDEDEQVERKPINAEMLLLNANTKAVAPPPNNITPIKYANAPAKKPNNSNVERVNLGNFVRSVVNQSSRGEGALSIRLKPCVVCGDKSTGYHFGVISCEACKSFYRRSLKRTNQYFCEKGGNCPANARGTNSCPACRLKRCKMVGMSPDAVKKGRYSLEKRAETIIQSRMYWQNVQQQQDMHNPGLNNNMSMWSEQNNYAPAMNPSAPPTPQPFEYHQQYQESPPFLPQPNQLATTPTNENWGPAQIMANYDQTFTVYSDGKVVSYPSEFKARAATTIKQEKRQETYTHTIVDYSQLGSYVTDMTVDGVVLSEKMDDVIKNFSEHHKKQQELEAIKANEPPAKPVVRLANNEVAHLLFDGHPVRHLFSSLRPKVLAEGLHEAGRSPITAKKAAARKQKNQQYQNVLKFYSPVEGTAAEAISPQPKGKKASQKPIQNKSQRDLQETAEALIDLATFPIDNKAKEQPMQTASLPQSAAGGVPVPGSSNNGVIPSIPSAPVAVEYIDTSGDMTLPEQTLLTECVSSVDDCIELEEIDQLIQTTFENVEKNKFISDEAAETIPEIQRRFLDQRTRREQLYGKVAPTSTEEYIRIYKTTGVDGPSPDKDPNYMERIVQMFVQLYKSFPGYNNLPIDDQATLLKGTKEDVGYIMNIKLVNVKDRLLTSQFLDITYDMNYFTSFAPEETVLKTFLVAERVQNLDLNKVETAIGAAFVAMQPEVCKTNEGRLMCQMQRKKTLKALYKTLCMERTRENSIDIIKEIFAVLKLLKVQENTLSNQWDRFIQNCN